jgi:hypothetical protein
MVRLVTNDLEGERMGDIVVYGLHNGDGEIRYVGLTRKGARHRLLLHRNRARSGAKYPVYAWMRKYGHLTIETVVLQECDSLESVRVAEQEWIAKFRQEGRQLLNLTDGGEGTIGIVMSAANRKAMGDRMRGRVQTPEETARRVATRAGYRHSPETRAKMSASSKGRPAKRGSESPNFGIIRSKETRELLRQSRLGTVFTPEQLENQRVAMAAMPPSAAKLTIEQVLEIEARAIAGESQVVLGLEFGVNRRTIGRIKLGQSWNAVRRDAARNSDAA